ncbi:ParB/RepB/Spo0J family partition protein [Streptomyces diastaticus]
MSTKTSAKKTARNPKTSLPAGIPFQPPASSVPLDPALLVRDHCNARTINPEPSADQIASIKALGVQDAISVRPRPDGTFGVFKGWRRAQAAQEANRTAEADGRERQTVNAFVWVDLADQDGWTRMLSAIENDQRDPMAKRDSVAALEQCLLDMPEQYLSVASKALGVRRGAVAHAKAAQRLDDATLRRAAGEGLDLEQMAHLEEVVEVPNAQRRLLEAHAKDGDSGKRGHWDQAMALLRAEMAHAQERAAVLMSLEEQEVQLLRLSYWDKDPSRPLAELTTPLGNELTAEAHRECPGHRASVDEDNKVLWHCADPGKYKHPVRPEAREPKRKLSAEESAQRRRTIEGNRAWVAAREPRLAFITSLCRGAKLPEEARLFALRTLLELPALYAKYAGDRETDLLYAFMGKAAKEPAVDCGGLLALPKAKEAALLMAHVAAAYEHSMSDRKCWTDLGAQRAAWLLLLESLGHTLSEVEQEAVARHRPAAGNQG